MSTRVHLTMETARRWLSALLTRAKSCIHVGSSQTRCSTVRCILHFPIIHANFLFLDSFSVLTNTAGATYNFSSTGIAWPGEAKKYATAPSSEYNVDNLVPPPNWAKKFPNYNSSMVFPDLKNDEHFQNWMRTSGLPTFSKLYGRNDGQDLEAGTYTIIIDMSECIYADKQPQI